MSLEDQPETLLLAGKIVSAYVANHTIEAGALPGLLGSVITTLKNIGKPQAATSNEQRPQPAVPIKNSASNSHITCLENGKKMTMLKRHLLTDHGLTPAAYRLRWGLPNSYPMIAPAYAQRRSDLAKKFRLGHARSTAEVPREEPASPRSELTVKRIPEGVSSKARGRPKRRP